MNNLDHSTQSRLRRLAYKLSRPFCYCCYKEAPSGRCSECFSDDLMRYLPGDGVEFGIDWVIEHLIRDNLTPVNADEAFEDSIRDLYPETIQVGWLSLDTVQTIKDSDPVSWNIAQSEWLSNEEGEGLLTTFDGGTTYYYTHDIENYLVETETALDLDEIECVSHSTLP